MGICEIYNRSKDVSYGSCLIAFKYGGIKFLSDVNLSTNISF